MDQRSFPYSGDAVASIYDRGLQINRFFDYLSIDKWTRGHFTGKLLIRSLNDLNDHIMYLSLKMSEKRRNEKAPSNILYISWKRTPIW